MALYWQRSERQLAELRDLIAQTRDVLERKLAERTVYLEILNSLA